MARFKTVVNDVTKNDDGSFTATGTIRDLVGKTKTKVFTASTIDWQGAPIFKVEGAGNLADRRFKRGERISIARKCKAARLELEAAALEAAKAAAVDAA